MPSVINTISKQQADFCDISEISAKAIIAAKGAGKTFIGARFVCQMVEVMPGSKGIFACATNRQTADIWEQDIKKLLDQLSWKYTINETKGIVRFWNGTTLHLRSAESPERIESLQYEWGWQDEVSLSSLDFCKTFSSRIRGIRGNGHKRFTSMPDDPEHWIYTYLEDICDSFHELSLYDNPDPEFVKSYLKNLVEIYNENELKRYLEGKRISLAGMTLFSVQDDNRKDKDYDPAEDIYLVWDFNNEYRAVTAWQQDGLHDNIPVMNCIESFQMKEAVTLEDARVLARNLKGRGHKANIILHGDASGDSRTAAATETMWKQVRSGFQKEFPGSVRYVVPDSNPNVKDTIQITNWALRRGLVFFSDKSKVAYRYLMNAKSDKYGEIDKSRDNQPDAPRTHEVDTIRYLCFLVYEKHFPGSKRKVADIEEIKSVYEGDEYRNVW